jgi:ribokinase
MVGAVGDDAHGAALLEVLRAEGVDCAHVRTVPGAATGVALITVASQGGATGGRGENTIVVASGANASLSPADVDAARGAIADADVVLMQMECPAEAVLRAAQIAKERGATVILNAAPAHPLSAELLCLVDVLVVNRVEARTVARGRDPEMLGVATLIVTRGAEGATIVRAGRTRHVAAFAVSAVDSVGAGDAFAGALATRWAEHQAASMLDEAGIADALCWACAAGALATTRPGAIPSLPRREEAAALLRRSDEGE